MLDDLYENKGYEVLKRTAEEKCMQRIRKKMAKTYCKE